MLPSHRASQPPPPAPVPAPGSGKQTRMRALGLLPSFPRFTSLPFPQLQLHRYDWPADLFASSNKRRALAPVLLGRTKQKQSENGRRRSEAAAEAEGVRSADRDPGERRRRQRPEGSVPARLARPGGLRPLHSPGPSRMQPHVGRGRGRGGRGRVWSGQGRRGWGPAASSEPRRPHLNARGSGEPTLAPSSGPRPGARRRGPAPSRTPSPLCQAREALGGAGPCSSPRRPRLHFYRGSGRWEAGF